MPDMDLTQTLEDGAKPRILVVDDERFNRNVLADLLKPDYTVVLAKNGEQALQKIASDNQPNLILLDIVMPGMDGYEVCRRLKGDPRTEAIPVIFVSSMQDAEDEMLGLAIGAIDFIGKPFSPAIVKARVRNHIALAQAHAKVTEARVRLTALLDNSEQGFLSFGPDFKLDGAYSRQCKVIFGQKNLAGKNIPDLLHPGDEKSAGRTALNLRRIMEEPDDYIQGLYISLMPSAITLGDRHYQVQYKMQEAGRMMLILTDVTTQRTLEDAVRNERNRLAFIVAAFTDSRIFREIVENYEQFRNVQLPLLLKGAVSEAPNLGEAYRLLHTFKGLFSQFNFIHMPDVLHELETHVHRSLKGTTNGSGQADAEALPAVLAQAPDLEALQKDKDIISQALGRDFFQRHDSIVISREQADNLEHQALRLLHDTVPDPAHEVKALISEIRRIRMVDVKDLLRTYPTACHRLAERYEKRISPFSITGESVHIAPEPYTNFAKSLIHVFRNAVDHGIETPEEREEAGKDAAGRITCGVHVADGDLMIEVSDDGRGIDVNALRRAIVAAGIVDETAAAALPQSAVLDYVFHDTLSTKDTVSNISGRGVGLASVKGAIDELGGSVTVATQAGKETTFRFTVPLHAAL